MSAPRIARSIPFDDALLRGRFTTGIRAEPSFTSDGLSYSRLFTFVALALSGIFLNKLGLSGNVVFFAIILYVTLAGTAPHALMATTLFMLAVCANNAFVAKTSIWTVARFINLFTFTGRFSLTSAGMRGTSLGLSYATLLLFCATALICSLASGYYLHISLLKLFSFTLGMTGLFTCIARIRNTRADTTEWFIAQGIVVAILSAISLAAGVGSNFVRSPYWNERLFNLAFYHPNTAGPLFSQFALYAICVLLFTRYRNRWICVPLIGCLGFFLALSGSRTGAASLAMGAAMAAAISLFWHRKGAWIFVRRFSRLTIVLSLAGALLTGVVTDIATGNALSKKVVSFVAKSDKEQESVSVDEIISSRKAVVEHSYQNFLQSPILGIGFQVATTEFFQQNASIFYAPVEKGFLPTALLEEVGVVGAAAFAVFALTLIAQLTHGRNAPGLILFVSLLVINCGEVSIFALAGHGAYQWMLVLAGILLGDRCFKRTAHP